ncbi:AAA family ATPase [Coprococcus comes]|uniref:AAA family ATPase n=1 Tax=Coprococcus comes TaxID=410072 RepID=UPI00319DED1E
MKSVISIGNQDFISIRKNNCFYIDKTDFIREWWENQDSVTLITRPRRFGKTLNMSMTEYFFSVNYSDMGQYFKELSIWKEERFREIQGTYPVISLSFADIKATTYESARMSIIRKLVRLYSAFDFIRSSEVLNEKDRTYFDSVGEDMSDDAAAVGINYMSDYLSRYYGKKVIILLDEYDTPLQEAYVHGYWEELTAFIRSLFNSTFKTNPYMERGLLTGITRVSKESIFSDLNNLEVVTTTSEKYSTSFGFTEEEVFTVLENAGIPEEKEHVRYWYDGFSFGNRKDIYNPWSITKYLDTGEYGTYWADTSGNALVSTLIRHSSAKIKSEMEDLLNGGEICTELDEQVIFEQLGRKRGAIWSLLLASGYLKTTRHEMDRRTGKREYFLKITNHESMLMFEEMIESWFAEEDSAYGNFKEALLAGDLDYMNQFMNQVALQSFSSFDSGTKPSENLEPERFYHGFVLGLIVDLAGKYHITSNRESGFGRYDVVMEPLQKQFDAIVMEFKVQNPAKEESLQHTVQNALLQIEEKNYDTELLARGIPKSKIRHYGFAFCGKKVLIGTDKSE